ncbi:MAG: SNF2 helicase associated domain-containing protein [Candidatus Sericytochromatia bacterium]|nr:SNF2 helicase associated domain-containing protein [Candidatus Sericytochromatia bacterium]
MRRTIGHPISAVATPQLLRRWTGDPIFEQGQQSAADGLVQSSKLEASSDGVWNASGIVNDADGQAFHVSIAYNPGRGFDSDCNCPYGYRCKHAVALVLSLESHDQHQVDGSQWQNVLTALLDPTDTPPPGQSALVLTLAVEESPTVPSAYPFQHCLWVTAARGRIRQDGIPGTVRSLKLGARRQAPPTNSEDMLLEVLARFDQGLANRGTPQSKEALPIPAAGTDAVLRLLASQPYVYGPDGLRLRLSDRPLRPSLVTTDTPDGGCELRLQWLRDDQSLDLREPAVLGAWLYAEGVFYPIGGPLPNAAMPLLKRSLMIPKDELGEFTARFLPKLVQAGRIHAENHSAPPILTDVKPAPQLHLQEQGGDLVAHVTWTYGQGVITDSQDERELLPWPGNGWVRRDLELEKVALARLDAIGWQKRQTGSWFTTGEQALEIVAATVPQLLTEGWEVYGAQLLPSYRVNARRPRITARIRSGIDWFQLEQQLWVGDQQVDPEQLIQALRKRQQWVRLGNGEHLRLPEAWLSSQQQASEILGVPADMTLRVPKYQAGMIADMIDDLDDTDINEDWTDFWRRLQGIDSIAPQPLSPDFHGVLRPYQHSGFDYLCFLRDHALHGILADDMGLGKTIQALALLASERNNQPLYPTLLVAPTSVVGNWAAEAERFVPELKIGLWQGKDRQDRWEELQKYDVIVTSYALVWRDLALLQKQPWHYIILDEAQMIKNPSSQTARAVRRLQANHRLALTGTPIENNLMELWSLFAFLLPGLLGTESAFRRTFEQPIAGGDSDMMTILRRRVSPFILRRLKDDVATDLPPRTEVPLLVDLLPAQRRFYDTLLATCRQEVMATVAEKGWQRSQITAIEALLRLRQVCCDPRLIGMPDAQRLPSAKLQAFSDLIQEVIAEGHRVLVFSQFVKMLQLLKQHLDAVNIPYFYLDGQTKERQKLVTDFNAGDTPIFLISLKAGGTGLNLTGADYVIHFDPWWNPAAEDQATDRAHRIGQDKPVFSYKLIARDTVEEKIIALQAKKRRLVDGLLQAEIGPKQLTADDLAYLFEPSLSLVD